MSEVLQGKNLLIKHRIVPYTRGRGLDLACGAVKTWPHFIGVDNLLDWHGRITHPEIEPATRFSLRMSVDVHADAFELSMFAGASMDFVLASHILDLAKRPEAALKEWWRIVKSGGSLIIYGPSVESIPQNIIEYMQANAGNWDLVEYEEIEKENLFFQVFKKI